MPNSGFFVCKCFHIQNYKPFHTCILGSLVHNRNAFEGEHVVTYTTRSHLNVEMKSDIIVCYSKTQAEVLFTLKAGPVKSSVLCLWLQEGTNDYLESRVVFVYAAVEELDNKKKSEISCRIDDKKKGKSFYIFVLIPKREIPVKYVSCFHVVYRPDLNDAKTKIDKITVQKCATFCFAKIATPFAGVSASGECRCGFIIGSTTRPKERDSCSGKCPGDDSEDCGKHRSFTVFGAYPPAMKETNSKGCWRAWLKDEDWDIPYIGIATFEVGQYVCRLACHSVGYAFTGIHSAVCRCANSYGKFYQGPDEKCNLKCRRRKTEFCGGGGPGKPTYNNVYGVGLRPGMKSLSNTSAVCSQPDKASMSARGCNVLKPHDNTVLQCPSGCCLSGEGSHRMCYHPKLKKRLGVVCSSSEECIDDASHCTDEDGKQEKFRTCRCKLDISYPYNNACRIKKKAGEMCDRDIDCLLKTTSCKSSVCTCVDTMYEENGLCHKTQVKSSEPAQIHVSPIGIYKANVLALEGLPVHITCHVPGRPKFMNHTFVWFYGDKLLEPNNRIQVTNTGDLQILQAEKTDTGNYVCLVKGAGSPEEILHHLTVYTLPKYMYGLKITHQVTSCGSMDNDTAEFRERLCQQDPCVFHHFKSECKNEQAKSGKNTLKLSFVLRFEPQYSTPVCSPTCVQKVVLTHLKTNLALLKGKIKDEEKLKKGLQMKMHESLYIICAAGFTYMSTYCAPCPPGTYSERGHNNKCLPCARGFYSSQHGSPGCAACPPQHSTDVEGASSVDYCFKNQGKKVETPAAQLGQNPEQNPEGGPDLVLLSAVGAVCVVFMIITCWCVYRIVQSRRK